MAWGWGGAHTDERVRTSSHPSHPLQQVLDALAEAPAVAQVAGPKVGAEGLVDEVRVEVHADRVGRRHRQRHGLLQAVEVEAAGDDFRRAGEVIAVGAHGGGACVRVSAAAARCEQARGRTAVAGGWVGGGKAAV